MSDSIPNNSHISFCPQYNIINNGKQKIERNYLVCVYYI